MQKRISCRAGAAALGVLLCASLAGNSWQHEQSKALTLRLQAQRQRELSEVADAISSMEVSLSKLLIAAGAAQSVPLLFETALLAQHVESGLSRLPITEQEAAGAMKFAGQMGQYAMTLATQMTEGAMLTQADAQQLGSLLSACRLLGNYLSENGEAMYTLPKDAEENVSALLPEEQGEMAEMLYPSLIYDGPFSDGRAAAAPKGLTGERVTREQARSIAARAAGTTDDRVFDAADSGGTFEAFGFLADAPQGKINVQITGQGGRLLWMIPERAEFAPNHDQETCVSAARIWLADMGFSAMQDCFVQAYDGMVIVNFASVQEGVLLYPDQVKVQVSMETGTVVGAECTQYLSNHAPRQALEPKITLEEAESMVSAKLKVSNAQLCVIPKGETELLCWEFAGTHQGAAYRVYINAQTGEAAEILRIVDTPQGEAAL